MNSFKDAYENPITRYCIIASASRFMIVFSQAYYLPAFFLKQYPNSVDEIAFMFSVTAVGAGITTNILGGLLADRFGSKDPLNYSRIAIAGSALAWPLFLLSVKADNFWLAMMSTNLNFLMAETSWPANMTMLQRAGPPDSVPSRVTVY